MTAGQETPRWTSRSPRDDKSVRAPSASQAKRRCRLAGRQQREIFGGSRGGCQRSKPTNLVSQHFGESATGLTGGPPPRSQARRGGSALVEDRFSLHSPLE